MSYVIWGLAKDETRDYMEDLIADVETIGEAQQAIAWAKAQGFHSIRTSTFDGVSLPDFIGSINV
jgi:hypothetical protein